MVDSARSTVNVEGERVALGPMRRDLVPLVQRWNNDAVTNRTTAGFRPTTLEQEAEAYEKYTIDPAYALFTVYEQSSQRPIGMTYLADIDHSNRSAVFGFVIGEAECRGKGYGTEATRLTLEYAFTALGLHSVMLWVLEYNEAGRRCYTKAGFREVGRWRQSHWHNGQFWDWIMMDILASEFESLVLKMAFEPPAPL